jgi:hypothetical protein
MVVSLVAGSTHACFFPWLILISLPVMPASAPDWSSCQRGIATCAHAHAHTRKHTPHSLAAGNVDPVMMPEAMEFVRGINP